MSAVLYYALILPLSFLPMWVLHRISDFLCFLLYRIVGYRKKVVETNINNSFPDKSKEERITIMRNFYRHFCDLVVESVKLFSISESQIRRRFTFTNAELLERYYAQNKDIVLVGGHFNNWEILAVGIDQQMKHKAVGIYMPLSSPFFDQKLRETRSKFGLHMIPTKVVADFFAQTHDQAQVVIFGADQSPTNTKKVLWTTFLHQETAVALGAERYAKLYDLPVFFGTIHKIKRGYYSFDIQLVTDQPKSTNDGFITEAHVALLEKDIINEPQYWLWTHRRWKRKR